MTSPKVSPQERKDIERDIKRLIVKFIQVVLQSRNGIKANYPSKLFGNSTDWFCLSIPDLPQISAQIKSTFDQQPMDIRRPLCIEISLRTTEDETMVLEYWWLVNTGKTTQVRPDPVYKYYKASSPVLNYIGTLLRSLLIATRSTPAYRLSRNQSASNYCLQHKLVFEEPEFYVDDEFKKHSVGTVPSPLGDMNLFVAYKTKLLMSPRKMADFTCEIRDDYFNVDVIPMTPKKTPTEICQLPDQNPDSVENYESDFIEPVKVKKAAFGPVVAEQSAKDSEDISFASLLQYAKMSPIHGRRKRSDSEEDKQNSKHADEGIGFVVGQSMQQSNESIQSTESCSYAKDGVVVKDDFVMIDLKPPFAGIDEDLSQLFQKMIDVPSLSIFEEPVSYFETVNYLEDQLAHFEAMGAEFNNFVKSIQTPGDF